MYIILYYICQDAGWVLHHTIPQCSTFTDLLLLLKSSDQIGKELVDPLVYMSFLIRSYSLIIYQTNYICTFIFSVNNNINYIMWQY